MTKNGILIELAESEHTGFGRVAFAEQSTPQKVFSSIWAVESEVNNGGFAQYLSNESGETATFVIEALNTIGAPRTADICRRALDCRFSIWRTDRTRSRSRPPRRCSPMMYWMN